jgi:hypothetical protein
MIAIAAAMLVAAFVMEPRLERLDGGLQASLLLGACAGILVAGVALARRISAPRFDTAFFALIIVPMLVFLLFVVLQHAACAGWVNALHCPVAQD